MLIMKKTLALALAFACFSVIADWAKSYPWDDSENQTWEISNASDKIITSSGGWSFCYQQASGYDSENDIDLRYIEAAGSDGLVNFDTLERDTGLRLRRVGTGTSSHVFRSSAVTKVYFPATIIHLYQDSFESAKSLTAAYIPDDARCTLGVYAFGGCAAITYLYLGGVTEIGAEAVEECTSSMTIVLAPCLTSIGKQAFKRCVRAGVTVREIKNGEVIPEVDGTIATEAFLDFSENGSPTREIVIPFRGSCTLAEKCFHWTQNTDHLVFWGKAPTECPENIVSDGNWQYGERKFLVPKGYDDAGWTAFATACTGEEKARDDYPGDDVCIGTRVVNTSGMKYWVCWSENPSPYASPTVELVTDDGATTNAYATIAVALSKTTYDPATVLLLTNITEDITIPFEHDIVLDAGEYALTGDITVNTAAKLTINDGYYNGAFASDTSDAGGLWCIGTCTGNWKLWQMEYVGQNWFYYPGLEVGSTKSSQEFNLETDGTWTSSTMFGKGDDVWTATDYGYVGYLKYGTDTNAHLLEGKFDFYANKLTGECRLVSWPDTETAPAKLTFPVPTPGVTIKRGLFTAAISDDWVDAGSVKRAVSVVKDSVAYSVEVAPKKPGLRIILR